MSGATYGGRSAICGGGGWRDSLPGALAAAAIIISLAVIVWVLFNVEPTFNCQAAEDRIQAFEECRTIEGCKLTREDVRWNIDDRRKFEENCDG